MKNREKYIRTIKCAICFAGTENILRLFLLNEIKKLSPKKYDELKEFDNEELLSKLVKLA